MTTVIGLSVLAVLMFGPAGVWLERASWPHKAPRAAIALWQSIGVAGALAAVGAGVALAVEPLHTGLLSGLGELLQGSSAGHPLPIKGIYEAIGLTLSANVVAILVAGVVVTASRTIASRRRHRILLDLVSVRSDQAPGAVLLSDSRATAYCLPGRRSRIVVSAGALDLLDSRELAAVVDHERGHVQERHHLILLPFSSMIEMLELDAVRLRGRRGRCGHSWRWLPTTMPPGSIPHGYWHRHSSGWSTPRRCPRAHSEPHRGR